jgi:hypothetical protein
MPRKDITITLQVSVDDGQGKPSRSLIIRKRVPGDGNLGLTIPAGAKTALGTMVEQLGDILDRDQSDL